MQFCQMISIWHNRNINVMIQMATQQILGLIHQCNDSNGNTPSNPSDQESDDENCNDEIQVSSYER